MTKSRSNAFPVTEVVDYTENGLPITYRITSGSSIPFDPARDRVHIPFRTSTNLMALLRECGEDADSPMLNKEHAEKISYHLNQNDRKERIKFLTMAIDAHLSKVPINDRKQGLLYLFVIQQSAELIKSKDIEYRFKELQLKRILQITTKEINKLSKNDILAAFEKYAHSVIHKETDNVLSSFMQISTENNSTLLKEIVLSLPRFALKRILEARIVDETFFNEFKTFITINIGNAAAESILQSDKITNEQKIDLVMRHVSTKKLAGYLLETLSSEQLADFFVNREGMKITFNPPPDIAQEALKETQEEHFKTEIDTLTELSPKHFKSLFQNIRYNLLAARNKDSLSTSLPRSTTHIVACRNTISYPTPENIQALKKRGEKLKHGNNPEELRVLGDAMIELSNTLNTKLQNQELDSEIISLEITLNKMLSSAKIDLESKKKILDAGYNFINTVNTMRKNHPTQIPELTLHVMRCKQMVNDLHHEKYSLRRHNEKTKLVQAPAMSHSFADAVVAILNSVADTIRQLFASSNKAESEKKSTNLGFFAEGRAMEKVNETTRSLLKPLDPFGKNRVRLRS